MLTEQIRKGNHKLQNQRLISYALLFLALWSSHNTMLLFSMYLNYLPFNQIYINKKSQKYKKYKSKFLGKILGNWNPIKKITNKMLN